jgi:hypothetical protein
MGQSGIRRTKITVWVKEVFVARVPILWYYGKSRE